MTRVLQIRRGTTAQNNKFTGMAGELSFDTQTKTMRVHDGATLGGFVLARADQIGDGVGTGDGGTQSEFDINTVSAEFWKNIVTEYAPQQIKIHESGLFTIANVSYLEYVSEIAAAAKFAHVMLVCQTPEAGYSIDDVVPSFGIGTRTNPMPFNFSDSNGLHTRLFVGGENFWVSHKTTGVQTSVTNAKWKAKFIIWY